MPTDAVEVLDLLDDFSVEMTGKDVAGLVEVGGLLPTGTRVNVTYLGNEDVRMRLEAAREAERLGFRPVAHISARRLATPAALEEYLVGLRGVGGGVGEEVFVVGGDPTTPQGPYPDALSVIRSGLLQEHGVRSVGITGYPEGHPSIPDHALWGALADKYFELQAQELAGSIITQFAFDAHAVLGWVQQVRECGIDLPVRVGVPGPAGVRRLLGFAARFGVGTSASIARKYGLSLTNLMGTAGPDRFLRALAEGYDPAVHGALKVHFYTFGGLRASAEWIIRFQEEGRR
ncbi:methylenetetrahydrofolate reductase [Actinospica durhamensis]|uniref:Methylenetetrahydrofolate reductase n=1 Tax=Actinospica durhamensis TaxID=1508375 RepID=A0A941ESF6_9ACTN|nr:methylenetetrahydrofolate reductase [Actinospica durhamensis]MBR7836476.1 methylenetetrahydrofolate reductase [Actinospica durhamensis]